MFIAHKTNVVNSVQPSEWECRRDIKGLSTSEYWTWLDSVTTVVSEDGPDKNHPTYDLSGETGYTIVECNDEDVDARLIQLNDYISDEVGEEIIYNIKYYASKRDTETEIKDEDENSYDPKQYVQSHFIGDDSAKDARLLAEEWKRIRAERDGRIAETDWMMLSDTGTVSAAWKNYRKALREIPQSQDSVKTFADIDWPVKPSS